MLLQKSDSWWNHDECHQVDDLTIGLNFCTKYGTKDFLRIWLSLDFKGKSDCQWDGGVGVSEKKVIKEEILLK